ncbi:mRNA decay activator protein ZFP36L3-like isoform X2 [Anser cygnoides]|uniref:mRNA decay activator protein ZFP36L3-like isoform X2 n=1 Tax=Anser cygnoides TaxID=8845 RepID=UPI0034D1CC03
MGPGNGADPIGPGYGVAVIGPGYGAAAVRYGAAAGRALGAAARGLSRGAAALLGSPGFGRAHAAAVAALVGLGPALRHAADPKSLLAAPHNLLEARLVASAGRWTALLLGALLIASLPLAQPGGGRRGAVLRAAGRLAVGATVMAAAAPRLFAALEAAAGLRPSPQAFGLVLCGLGLGEELGALARLLHPPRVAGGEGRVASGRGTASGDAWLATGRGMATEDAWLATGRGMATEDAWLATGRGMATEDAWLATGRGMATGERRMATGRGMATEDAWLATGRGMATGERRMATGRGMATGERRMATGRGMATEDTWMATGSGMATRERRMATGSEMAPGEAKMAAAAQPATGEARPVATTPLCLLFLLNAGLLVLWQGALAAILAYRCHWAANAAGAGLGWAAWAFTYRLWYRCPCSPGRPGLGLRPRGGWGG